MTIEYGSIKKYIRRGTPDEGFGFVGRTFSNLNGEVFFNSKKISRKHPDLARKLENGEDFEAINFWYKTEIGEKGERVSELWLNANNIPKIYTDELCALTKRIESIWREVSSPKPSWIDRVTIDLVGVDRKHELSIERDNLESQLRAAEEEQRREAEARREREIARMAKAYELTKIQATEFEQLIAEMRPLQFTHSKQLSNYIVKHQLGYRYQNISGIVRMEEDGIQWDFPGGFSPNMYRNICEELDLDNQRTRAKPIIFRPFKDLI